MLEEKKNILLINKLVLACFESNTYIVLQERNGTPHVINKKINDLSCHTTFLD